MFQKPAFGASTSGFGMQSTFGSPAAATASPFGGFKAASAPSAFGAPPAFGATTSAQPATGGLFGATNTGGGLFGGTATAAPAAGFGANTSGFGFSAAAPAGGGMFGQAAPAATGGLFGQTQPNTAFGAKPPGFGFGATSANTGAGGGLFGATSQAGTSLFGQQNNTMTGGGLFANNAGGFGAQAVAQSGTAHTKYNPLVGQDVVVKNGSSQNINIKHHCITCMKEYDGKSLEELRLEDYTAGRKGPTSGVFAFQQENKPLFGATNTFGQPATTSAPSVFGGGAMSSAGFGQTNTFSFGGNTQANTNTTGMFGANKPAFGATSTAGTSLFGAPASTQASTFGTNTSTFGFGSNLQNQSSGGIFGAKPAATGFGAAPAAGFGGFGAGGGMFGAKPAQTQAPAFGAPQPGVGTMAGGFGTSTSASGGLFGGGSAFGKPATSQPSFGFGTAQPTLGLNTGLNTSFQNKPAVQGFGLGSSMFPQQQPLRTGLEGGLGGGMFGNNTGLGNTSLGLGMNANNNAFANLSGASAAGNVHEQILALAARPYGDSPLFKDLLPDSSTTAEDVLKPTNPQAQAACMHRHSAYRVTSSPASRLSLQPRPTHDKKSLFDGLEESDASLEGKLSLKPSRKRLVLRPNQHAADAHADNDAHTGVSFRSQEDSQAERVTEKENVATGHLQGGDRAKRNIDSSDNNNLETSTDRHGSWMSTSKVSWNENEPATDAEAPHIYPNISKDLQTEISERRSSWLTTKTFRPPALSPDSAENSVRELGVRPSAPAPRPPLADRERGQRAERVERDTEDNIDALSAMLEAPPPAARDVPPHPTGVKCTRPGYYTIPSLDDMIKYIRPDGSCVVPHFTVGRTNYGNVYFDAEIDVAGLDIDTLVHFLNKEVIIYPEDSCKPAVGSGLNRRAIVTLDRVWPMDKTQRRLIDDPDRLLTMDYEGKLRRVSDKHDTKFIEYRPQTGSWVFRVEHFSKYGLTDSDEEEDVPDVLKRQLLNQSLQKNAAPAMSMALVTPSTGLGGIGLGGPGLGGVGLSGPGLGGVGLGGSGLGDPGLSGSGLGGLGLSGGGLISSEDSIFAMQQSSINLLSGAAKAFEMDTTEDNAESSLYQDNRAFGVKSPTSELARLEHRQSAHVQLMKASLYAETEIEDDISVSTGDQLVPMSAPSVVSRDVAPAPQHADQYVAEAPPLLITEEPQMLPLLVQPHTIVLKYHRKVPPFNNTIAGRLDAAGVTDMSVSRARHSRVGFGPGGAFVFATTYNAVADLPKNAELCEIGKYVSGRATDDWSEPVVARLALSQPDKHYNVQEVLSKHLDSLFQYSKFSDADATTCPKLELLSSPRERYAALKQIIQDAETDQRDQQYGVGGAYCLEVWKLCDALWGADLENDGIPGTDELSILTRHRRLLAWLTAAVADITDEDLSKPVHAEPEDEGDAHSSRVWTLVLGGRVLEACRVARDNGDLSMATLIAQAAGAPALRSLLSRQLSLWRECGADTLVSGHKMALLQLISGAPATQLADADWRQALLATAKYLCSSVPSLEQVTRRYEEMLDDPQAHMQRPQPSYLPREEPSENVKSVLDLRYLLIRARAFNQRPQPSPEQYTPDPFDYSLCFLLGIWFGHPSTQSIVGVASQLEAAGLWHRAVHALCYHPDDKARAHLINGVISRHVPARADLPEQKTQLELLQRLRIPQHWTLRAQAHRAKYQRLPFIETCHLVGAERWNEAHKVLLEELLPEAVLADNLESLSPLLDAMSAGAAQGSVSGWDSPGGGQALRTYLHVCHEIRGLVSNAEAMRDRSHVAARLEALRPAVAAACRALGPTNTRNPRSACALAEMGGRLVRLGVAAGSPPARLAALLAALHLPPDCTAPAHHQITTDLAEQASELCIESATSSPISAHHRAAATT